MCLRARVCACVCACVQCKVGVSSKPSTHDQHVNTSTEAHSTSVQAAAQDLEWGHRTQSTAALLL